MKMRKKVIVLIGLALFLANVSFAQQVKTDYDRAANFKRLSDPRPVSFVGKITEEVTEVAPALTPHITPAIRIMSMFQHHLLNPEDKEMMERVLFQ